MDHRIMENKSDKIAVERTEPEKVLPRPDPEVPAKATRRRFSARYKLRILEQADGGVYRSFCNLRKVS